MLGSGVSTVNKRNLAFAHTEIKVYLRTRNSRCDGWDERISPTCYENVDRSKTGREDYCKLESLSSLSLRGLIMDINESLFPEGSK